MMRNLVALGGAAVLVGCATPNTVWQKSVGELVVAGRCSDAHNVVRANATTMSAFYGVTSFVNLSCDKDFNAAKPNLNMAARYGNPWARKTLAERGQPVPVADLVAAPAPAAQQRQQANDNALGDALTTILGGYAAGRYGAPTPAAAPSTSPTFSQCDARRNTMGANIGMDQRYSVNCY